LGYVYNVIISNSQLKKLAKQGLGLLNFIECSNFNLSLRLQIKKQISIRGTKHWDYIFVGFEIQLHFNIVQNF